MILLGSGLILTVAGIILLYKDIKKYLLLKSGLNKGVGKPVDLRDQITEILISISMLVGGLCLISLFLFNK